MIFPSEVTHERLVVCVPRSVDWINNRFNFLDGDRMKTEIFESYEDFVNREDKSVNGVNQDYADFHPDFEMMNETNSGCWNCVACFNCVDCVACYGFEGLVGMVGMVRDKRRGWFLGLFGGRK